MPVLTLKKEKENKQNPAKVNSLYSYRNKNHLPSLPSFPTPFIPPQHKGFTPRSSDVLKQRYFKCLKGSQAPVQFALLSGGLDVAQGEINIQFPGVPGTKLSEPLGIPLCYLWTGDYIHIKYKIYICGVFTQINWNYHGFIVSCT